MSAGKTFAIAFKLGASVNSSMRAAFNTANQNINSVNQSSGRLTSSGNKLGKTFTALKGPILAGAAAFSTLVTGIGKAVSVSDDFQKAMQLVAAKTDETTVNMAEVQKIAKNLYKNNLGEDWTDLAESISTVQSVSKLSGVALQNATKNAILYRDVFGEEVTQSVKATDTMVKNFGITSDQAFNLLVQGAKKGLNKSDELLDSANEYSPYFSALGFSANQMFSTFSAGLENGAFNLDKVGDAVKEFNIRSKDGSKASAAAYKALGMDANKMAQIFATGGPVAQESFKKVVAAISSVKDPVKKNEIGVALMGTMFEDLEADVVAAMGTAKDQFDLTKESMESLTKVKYDNLSGALKGFGRMINVGILMPIGDRLLPVIQKAVSSAGKWIEKLPVYLKNASTGIQSRFNVVKGHFMNFVNSVAPTFNVIKKLAVPILLDAANFIEGIIKKVVTFWNENGAQIVQSVKKVFTVISKVVSVIAPVVFFVIKALWNNVKGVINGALDVILGAIKIFSSLFTGNWSGLWEGIKQTLLGALQGLWNLWNLMMMGRLVKGVGVMLKGITTFFKGFGSNIATNVQYYYHLFMDGFYKIGTGILKTIGKSFGSIITIARNGVTNFITVFQTARTFGVNIFMSLVSAIRNMFTSIMGNIRNIVSSVVSTATTRISGFIGAVKGFISSLLGTVRSVFTNIQIAMTSPFTALKNIATSVVNSVSSVVSGLFTGIQATGKGAINGLIMAANAMIGGINSLNVNVPDWVPGIGGNSIGFNIPQIPMLAKGGITTGPTLAMIGEGAEQEAVLPLSKLNALLNPSSNTNQSSSQQFVYSPVFHVSGNVGKEEVTAVAKQGFDEFKRWTTDISKDNKRLSFKS